MSATVPLALSLLGPPDIGLPTGTVSPTYKKARSLLYLLAAQPTRQHQRDRLAEMLWPDQARDSARANLRRMIHHLRDALEHPDAQPLLVLKGDGVQINEGRPLDLDTARFSELASCPGTYDGDHLAQAGRLYRGEFLQGWEDKSPPFEAWVEEQRRRWKARACSLFVRIAEDCARRGMAQAALDAAERAVEIDHADGHCLRTFLRLLAQAGRGVELAYEYDRHVRYLREEFDVEPEAATLHLYRQLVAASQTGQKVIPAGEDDAGILSRLHTAHHAMLRWDFVGAQELCRQIGGLLPRLPATSTRDVLHAEWRTLSNIADERQADREKVGAVKGPLARAMEKLPEGVFVMRFAAWAGAESRRGPAAAERIARQLVELSARCGDWARRRADMALTLVLFWQGKFVEARSIAESAELPALLPADVLERYGGGSVEIMIPCILAWVLLFCGEADTANARMAHALALARLRKEPISLSCSLGTAANLARWQDNPEQTLALAEELIAMAEHGAPPVLVGQARLLRYWARLRLGFVADDAEIAPALEDIRRMTPAMEAVGHIILAEAACAAGVAPESRAAIERAIASGDRYGHTHYHAVLYRLLAEWHALHGDPTHAASWLARAESLALRQGNRWAMARQQATERLSYDSV